MIKFLLVLVTFVTANPQEITLQQVRSFGNLHECSTYAGLHNQLAEDGNEVLACLEVKAD